jgi:hypothetical protein
MGERGWRRGEELGARGKSGGNWYRAPRGFDVDGVVVPELRSSVFLALRPERLPATRGVPRSGRVRLIEVNRGAISTGRAAGRCWVC